MYYILFIYLSADEQLSWFHFLITMNNIAMDIVVQAFV